MKYDVIYVLYRLYMWMCVIFLCSFIYLSYSFNLRYINDTFLVTLKRVFLCAPTVERFNFLSLIAHLK